GLDTAQIVVVRSAAIAALMTMRAPVAEIAAGADTVLVITPEFLRGRNAVDFASAFMGNEHTQSLAAGYARRGLALLPPGPESSTPRGQAEILLAMEALGNQQADSAIAHMVRALPDRPDSQAVLHQLGTTCAQTGREAEAIDYWIRALAVFGNQDSSMVAPLHDLYVKKYGSLKGLDQRVAAAHQASRRQIALEAPRVDEPLPDWTLADLDGKPVALRSLRGKIIVLDFWGSWCGPCRIELPHFEALYQRYRGQPIAFLSVNVEMQQSVEEHLKRARDFVAKNHYTFPVLPDPDGVAVQAHGIVSYPTLLLVDRAGRVRFRNVGYREGFDEIIAAQLATLIK
ncbi:MAG TPA: TlpA disulfide reductase family protein, partial [Candidatus Eisenbacteria bacterium]